MSKENSGGLYRDEYLLDNFSEIQRRVITRGPLPGYPGDNGVYTVRFVSPEAGSCFGRYLSKDPDSDNIVTVNNVDSNDARWRFQWRSNGDFSSNFYFINMSTGKYLAKPSLHLNEPYHLTTNRDETQDGFLVTSRPVFLIRNGPSQGKFSIIEAFAAHCFMSLDGNCIPVVQDADDVTVKDALEITLA